MSGGMPREFDKFDALLPQDTQDGGALTGGRIDKPWVFQIHDGFG